MSKPKLTGVENAIFRLLETAAEHGFPCPTNDQMADALGTDNGYSHTALKAMERKGYITIESGGGWRTITICATGKTTAPSGRRNPDSAINNPRKASREKRLNSRGPSTQFSKMNPEEIAARVERDQAAIRARRERHLVDERRLYGLPKRGRLIDDQPA